jgi:hypothetical protein
VLTTFRRSVRAEWRVEASRSRVSQRQTGVCTARPLSQRAGAEPEHRVRRRRRRPLQLDHRARRRKERDIGCCAVAGCKVEGDTVYLDADELAHKALDIMAPVAGPLLSAAA